MGCDDCRDRVRENVVDAVTVFWTVTTSATQMPPVGEGLIPHHTFSVMTTCLASGKGRVRGKVRPFRLWCRQK